MRTPRRGAGTSLVTVALLVGLMLSACGDDDDDEAESTTTTTAAPAVQGSASVRIDYRDYSYDVSGPLMAGGTLQLRNAGKELHMMGIGRLKDGKTLNDVTTALEQGFDDEGGGGEGREEDPLFPVLDEVSLPGNVMSPGASADVTVPDLGPGHYALICFIPTEGEGAPHFAKGMINELTVVEGDAPEPSADATYKVAPGKAVEGPATLTPGKHTLKIEAAAGSEQLEPGLVRLDQGETFASFDTKATELFEGEDAPPKGAAEELPGEITFAGFDLADVDSFFLTVDLMAGNYYLVAEDSDPEERPRPPKEILNIKVAEVGSSSTTRSTAVGTTAKPATTTTKPPAVTPQFGAACELGTLSDCIDPDGDGKGTYLKGGAACIQSLSPELCSDLDGDGVAGYPDSG